MTKDIEEDDDKKWPAKLVTFHPDIWDQLEELCRQNRTKMIDEIRIAVREKLKHEGLWPPTPF